MGSMENIEKPLIETFGFYPLVIIPLSFYFFLFLVAIYIQNFGGIIFFGLFSFLFLVGSIAKIKILRDGVVIERPVFGKSYWSFSEVKLRARGRILDYGGMSGGSIIPLKWRQCAQTITSLKASIIPVKEKPISRALPLLYIFFAPTVMVIATIISRHFHLLIPPLVWALAWATCITFSFIAYINSSPVPIKIGRFNKKQSSIIVGFIIGVIMFFSILAIM
ncbi:MAG: hypothetical protein ACPL1Z_01210 [Candidatus Bathyarchaeales archaeon]